MSADFASQDIESLAAKLDALDLTDAEQAILGGILDRAAAENDEVSGYGIAQVGLSLKGEIIPKLRVTPERIARGIAGSGGDYGI